MRSFGHIVWDNMVPEEIKLALTLEEFKKRSGAWIPNNCPCKLFKLMSVDSRY